MCLGVPGQVVEIIPNDLGMTMGKVDFGGVVKQICLAFTPEAEVGDYVLVHVGFAMSRIDEDHARDIFEALALLDADEAPAAVGIGPVDALR